MTEQEFITGGEFGRWRTSYEADQTRLQAMISEGFVGIHGRLDLINGRVRVNSEDIARIQAGGCGRLAQHEAALAAMGEPPITPARMKTSEWKNAGKVGGISAAVIGLVELGKAILAVWK